MNRQRPLMAQITEIIKEMFAQFKRICYLCSVKVNIVSGKELVRFSL